MDVYDLVNKNEGERLQMYDDATGKDIRKKEDIQGNPTIGSGHNLFARPISKRASRVILEDDVNDAVLDCTKAIPFFTALDVVRQAVLIDMCYNMGIAKLLGFHNMLNHMANRNWESAAIEMRCSRWARQTDRRGDEVYARPDRLEHMMRTGEWPDK